jgi:cystathionine beta-synthase
VPRTLNSQVVDEWVRVGDAESFHTARALARSEGVLVGGSSGTAVAAALRYARRLGPQDLVVALCPDTGRNYMSKFFDDNWLAENHLSWTPQPAVTIADLLRSRGTRQLATISPDATVISAVETMQSTGISQLPVLRGGLSVGSIQEVTLARILHDRADPNQVKVGEVMARPLPQLDLDTQLDEAYRLLLAGNTGVLAVSDGVVLDIITRIDLVQYWNQARSRDALLPQGTSHEQQPT